MTMEEFLTVLKYYLKILNYFLLINNKNKKLLNEYTEIDFYKKILFNKCIKAAKS